MPVCVAYIDQLCWWDRISDRSALIVPNLEALQQWADAQNLYQTGAGEES